MSTWATIKFLSLESRNRQTFVSILTNRAFASLPKHEDVAWLEILAGIFKYSEAVYRAFKCCFGVENHSKISLFVQSIETVCSGQYCRPDKGARAKAQLPCWLRHLLSFDYFDMGLDHYQTGTALGYTRVSLACVPQVVTGRINTCKMRKSHAYPKW